MRWHEWVHLLGVVLFPWHYEHETRMLGRGSLGDPYRWIIEHTRKS